MPRSYSSMVQEAQRSAKQAFGPGTPPPGTTQYQRGERQRTSGLDEASMEAQRKLITTFQEQLENVQADLSKKYEFARERLIGSTRARLGQRNIGTRSGVAAAAEGEAVRGLEATRAGEEFGLETARTGMLGQGLIGGIGLGRETYEYPLEETRQGPPFDTGGGSSVRWEGPRPESQDVRSAYERNRDRLINMYRPSSEAV